MSSEDTNAVMTGTSIFGRTAGKKGEADELFTNEDDDEFNANGTSGGYDIRSSAYAGGILGDNGVTGKNIRYNKERTAVNTWRSTSMLTSIDHHWGRPMFVTTGATVDIWDHFRSQPVNSFEWGCDMVYTARFNPAEPALLAATAMDNSISLYDLRANNSNANKIRKVILGTRSNALCWNPQDPNRFTVANENAKLYTFDIRNLSHAAYVHTDHVLPVLDIDYSPTGREFMSASYDKTIRLWSADGLKSRDVYHTKRMQRVLCCSFSSDGRFVFSGSEDHNVRVWKTNASEKLGVLSAREKKATAYRDKLKEKYSAVKEVARIQRHKHTPKWLKGRKEKLAVMKHGAKKKEDNRRNHSKPGAVPFVSERDKMVNEEEA